MRVAALYDIHGNLPALEAVLSEVERERVDLVVVGGDVVPGPMPSESLQLLLDFPIPVRFIAGNGDRDVVATHDGSTPARVPERYHETMRWVAQELTPEQLAQLSHWPATLTLELGELGTVLFCHATPRDDFEIFTRLTPEERLRPVFEATQAAVVVCGHTHMQFDRRIGRVRVVNAGSVGMPFAEPGAYWTLLDGDVDPRHTPYDLTAAAERVEATDYPLVSEFDVRNPRREAEMVEMFEKAALR